MASRVATRTVDGRGTLTTPGLVNTHHHLYQWITRGYAQDTGLFGWLTTLYPVWERLDEEAVHAAAAANLGWLSLSGCTLTTDHHYVFPRDGGDLLAAEIRGARTSGSASTRPAARWISAQSSGGLPPDSVVEDTEKALLATELAITTWHDPSPDSMLQIGVAPVLAVLGDPRADDRRRRAGPPARRPAAHPPVRDARRERLLHGRLSAAPRSTTSPTWAGSGRMSGSRTVSGRRSATSRPSPPPAPRWRTAPRPTAGSGSGIAPIADMLAAGVQVGLGVDGAASNESGWLAEEPHQAMLLARLRGGPEALTARQALRMATFGGAQVLGRAADLGSLEVGKLADIAVWRVDDLGSVDIADPVCALVFGSRQPLRLLLVNGVPVVERERDWFGWTRRRALAARSRCRSPGPPRDGR